MKKVVLSAVVFSFLAVSCGPSLCDCVNLDEEEASESKVEKCEKMKEDWDAKYKDASEEEKKSLQEEVKACKSE